MAQIGHFIVNHWLLWVLLIVVFIAIFINEFKEQKKQAQEVDPQTAVKLINDNNAVVIDLRDEENYRKGHIINAIRATPESFNKNQMDKYKTKPVILVCARGLESKNLATKLRQQGFTQPVILSGGISAWQNADLPLVKGK
ncbi:Rhodanese sulfurtransferase like protein [Legionella beliardensis]|uniref:Rhodanese sulfurtransferase like protein n=1 Tax=Legionella beliardensis TaxID=91822 RepID=A0A378I4G7_9GAMM|nr:rhodanese-like domain-containing protein [Legionella beliardensis]STX29615.1 Rhodanese sulfurtransferase like protein [Legionella beliardensis]